MQRPGMPRRAARSASAAVLLLLAAVPLVHGNHTGTVTGCSKAADCQYPGCNDVATFAGSDSGPVGAVEGGLKLSDCDGTCCRLDIFHNGEFGSVCDDYATQGTAEVACRQLGFASQGASLRNGGWGVTPGTGMIWLDDVWCAGTERTIQDCQHSPWGSHDCGHFEDLGVCCPGGGNGVRRVTFETAYCLGCSGSGCYADSPGPCMRGSYPNAQTCPPAPLGWKAEAPRGNGIWSRLPMWGMPEQVRAGCFLQDTWEDLTVKKNYGMIDFKTGGLGPLMQGDHNEKHNGRPRYQVWLCVNNHPCSSLGSNNRTFPADWSDVNANPYARYQMDSYGVRVWADGHYCFVFDEKSKSFVPWAPHAQLNIMYGRISPNSTNSTNSSNWGGMGMNSGYTETFANFTVNNSYSTRSNDEVDEEETVGESVEHFVRDLGAKLWHAVTDTTEPTDINEPDIPKSDMPLYI